MVASSRVVLAAIEWGVIVNNFMSVSTTNREDATDVALSTKYFGDDDNRVAATFTTNDVIVASIQHSNYTAHDNDKGVAS